MDFESAQTRIAPYIWPTPVSYHAPLHLHFKWENQQRTGSYKFRSALNKVLTLRPEQLQAELVAASCGNYGKAVATAAQLVGAQARIFVPTYTPQTRVEHIKKLAARVEYVPGIYQDAEKRVRAVVKETGAIDFSPYDSDTVAGNGSIALEWLAETPELTRLLIPVGGGGLIVGVALAARAICPEIEIIGVQAAASPYLYHQFYHGRMENVIEHPTLMQGLAGIPAVDGIIIDSLPQACDAIVLVTEEEVARAVAYAYHKLGQMVEASGAATLAAVLAGKVSTTDRPTGALISGGNIDDDELKSICTDFL